MKTLRYLAVSIFFSAIAFAQTPEPESPFKINALKAEEVAQLLAGPGISIGNVKLTGAGTAVGSFSGGSASNMGIDAGVIMSTGKIEDAPGPNAAQGTSGALEAPGDADLDKLVAPNTTKDATVLEFDFVTDGENFNIKYVFASEEYKEYVGSNFNDVFAFFLNGQNIALIPGTNSPVAINTVNHQANTTFYRDNPPGTGTINLEFDGFTAILIAQATVVPGQTYHIKLAIADTSDSILDSAVFLAQGGITGTVPTTLFIDPKEVAIENGRSAQATITGFDMPRKGELTLSAFGLPEDSTVTFSPTKISKDSFTSTVTVNVGPNTLPNSYVVFIRGADDEQGIEFFTTLVVHIDCNPPFIFGLPQNQPNSQAVGGGNRATLRVAPGGSGPFKYQWFQGPPGSTHFPVSGATTAEFSTPPVVAPTSYWVRVSNPCGSVDSDAAIVRP